MAGALRRSDAGRALAVYEHTLRHLAEIRGNSVIDRAEAEALAGSSAYSLRRMGRSPEARRRLNAAFDRLTQLKLYPAEKSRRFGNRQILRALADHEAANRNIPRAIDIYQKLLNRCGRRSLSRRPVWKMPGFVMFIRPSPTSISRNRDAADATSALRLNCGAAGTGKPPGNALCSPPTAVGGSAVGTSHFVVFLVS